VAESRRPARLRVVGSRGAEAAVGADPRGPARSIAGTAALVVSASAIRSAFGAWSATRPRQESLDVPRWPHALLVAMAVAESGRASLAASNDGAPWESDVTIAPVPRDLMRRTALSAGVVRRIVDALLSADVLESVSRVGDTHVVRLRPGVFEDAPVLGAVSWNGVRERLGVDLSSAALLTVRELAVRTTPEDRARSQFVPLTLRDLEEATGHGKGAVRSALAALARAEVVESRVRPRMDSWHRLLPAAFGAAAAPVGGASAPTASGTVGRVQRAEPPARPVEAIEPVAVGAPTPGGRPAADPAVPPRRVGGAPGSVPAVDDWAIVEINGVRFPVPPGVQPIPERDASGEWYLRVGPGLRYGPLRFFV